MLRVVEFLGFQIRRLFRRPERGFEVSLDDLSSELKSGVRAVILTNHHNPSGYCISRESMKAIADACEKVGATLVVDEVYLDSAHLNLGAPLWTAAHLGENVIGLNSLTKVYGLSGLRIGWLIAQPTYIERARDLMDMLSVHNAAPASSLALHAFQCISTFETRFRRFYQESQPIYRNWLRREPNLHAYENHGALFECLRLPDGVSANRLNKLLVEKYETQIVPGDFFDLPDHIRFTPAALPPYDLTIALDRISAALEECMTSKE
jgi:hypothetical protein